MNAVALMYGATRFGAPYLRSLVEKHCPVHREMLGPDPIVIAGNAELSSAILSLNQDQAWSCALGYRMLFAEQSMAMLKRWTCWILLDFDIHRGVRRMLQPGFSPSALQKLCRRPRGDVRHCGRQRVGERAGELQGDGAPLVCRRRVPDLHRRSPSQAGQGARRSRRARCGAPPRFSSERAAKPCLVPRAQRLRDVARCATARAGATYSQGTDLFTRLCQAQSDCSTTTALVRLFMGILLAAFDVTASVTTSMAYLLAKQPEWQERLREELMRVPWVRNTTSSSAARESPEGYASRVSRGDRTSACGAA